MSNGGTADSQPPCNFGFADAFQMKLADFCDFLKHYRWPPKAIPIDPRIRQTSPHAFA